MVMIKNNKKLNPFIGIAIGIFLIFFGVFGILFLFGDKLSGDLFVLPMLPFIISGTIFLALNSSFLGIRMLSQKIHESAELMNPSTFICNTSIITKVRDLYIVKFNDNYLNILRMDEKEISSESWYRRTFGPKLPTSFPLKCPVISEFNGFKIRKCIGKAVLYDVDENHWISGQATMFSIFLFKKPITQLLYPDILRDLINLIETI